MHDGFFVNYFGKPHFEPKYIPHGSYYVTLHPMKLNSPYSSFHKIYFNSVIPYTSR